MDYLWQSAIGLKPSLLNKVTPLSNPGLGLRGKCRHLGHEGQDSRFTHLHTCSVLVYTDTVLVAAHLPS